MLIDNERGVGATGNNGNVLYMGFVAFIRPSDFFELAWKDNSRQDRSELMTSTIEERGMGTPFLLVSPEKYESPWGQLKVTGHEGRARMTIIEKLNGNKPFPVHIFPGPELRARHMDAAFFEAMKTIKNQDGKPCKLELSKVFCNSKAWTI